MKSSSHIVSFATEAEADIFSSSNNKEQNVSTLADACAMHGDASAESAKSASANSTSGQANGPMRDDDDDSDAMNLAAGHHRHHTGHSRHAGGATEPTNNGSSGGTTSSSSTATGGSCDTTTPAPAPASASTGPDNAPASPAATDSNAPSSSSACGMTPSGADASGTGTSATGPETAPSNTASDTTGSSVDTTPAPSDSNCCTTADNGSTSADGSTGTGTSNDSSAAGSFTPITAAVTSNGNAATPTPAPVSAPDTTPPVVTAALGHDGITVKGSGDPNTAVTISENGKTVGSAQGDATGAWTFNAASLAPGGHTLVASETDAAGNSGSASPLTVAVSDPRFDVIDIATSASALLRGADYAGPVNQLQASYQYTGSDSSVINALVGNVFIHAGAGQNAAAAKDGNNVLAGGDGSSWLVGASGADGGADTFFVSAQGGQPAWDTLLNFHVGDMLTLWDFNSAKGSTHSVGIQGAAGSEGETLSVDFGNGAGASTLVTFAGMSSSAEFSTMTGSTGGRDFCMLTRTA